MNFTTPEVISGMSMLVALCAVIVGPIVTFKVAKRQLISPIRQKWIDELRELMSQFLSESRKIIILSEGNGLLNADKTDESVFQKLLYIEQKLGLMLNPNEDDHSDLVKLIHVITEDVQHGGGNLIEFGSRIGEATKLCQKVLKLEWKRVKGGEV
jgi:UDP-N-acetylenolpyruvoylglucosamine reductase